MTWGGGFFMEIAVRRGYSGFGGFLVEGIIFLFVFFLSFYLLTFLLPDSIVEQHDDLIFLITLVLTLAIDILVEYVMEKKYGETQQLLVTFEEQQCVLRKGRKEWSVPYQKITSVIKVMVINRFFDEKGVYRVTIKRQGHSSITFWTTEQEYEEHRNFEDTQLYKLYLEMKNHGVKCC